MGPRLRNPRYWKSGTQQLSFEHGFPQTWFASCFRHVWLSLSSDLLRNRRVRPQGGGWSIMWFFNDAFMACHRWEQGGRFRAWDRDWRIGEYSWSVKISRLVCQGADVSLPTSGMLPEKMKFIYDLTLSSGDEDTVLNDLSAAGHAVASSSQLDPSKSRSTSKCTWHTTIKVVQNSDGQEVWDISSEDCSDSGSKVTPQWRKNVTTAIVLRRLFSTLVGKRCGILSPLAWPR